MRRGESHGSVSASEGDDSDGSDFVQPPETRTVTSDQRAALTRATVEEVICRYVNAGWTLRAGQFEVASALWQQHDVVCTFPTSAGKTLIMMLGALLDCHHNSLGVWIVCQPLEALRKTTATKVKSEFFKAADVSVVVWDGMSRSKTEEPFDDPSDRVTVILCSPEQLSSVFSQLRRHVAVVRGLLVDEAHLRFAWEFRDYRTCDEFSTIFPDAAIGLFSATLDQQNADELARLMAMRDPVFFAERTFPELRQMKLRRWEQFSIQCCSSKDDHLAAAVISLFERLPNTSVVIVFASSYAKLAKLVEPLGREALRQFAPRFYCSSYDSADKETTIDEINSGRCRLVGATCALGAGVDLLNVGGIVFFGCPKQFSDATQGMGRAGRGQEAPIVEVIFASDSGCNSKVGNEMRILTGYCSDAKSSKTVRCNVCETVTMRPGVIGAEDSYKTCFDFKGIHCQRETRTACKLAMCKYFDGLLEYRELSDGRHDCGRCDSCLDNRIEYPVGCLVKYKGKDCVVYGRTPSLRLQIREVDTLENHTVAVTSLSLISVEIRNIPPAVELNDLTNKQRMMLKTVLQENFLITGAETGDMLLSSAPSDVLLTCFSRWTPQECARRCLVRFPNVDMKAWFENALTKALHGDGDNKNDSANVESGSEEENVSGSQPVEEASHLAGNDDFELDPGFVAFYNRHAVPLRQELARMEMAAQQQIDGHKLARKKRSAAAMVAVTRPPSRATKSLGGKDSSLVKTKSKKRRNTFGGNDNK